jgi:UDP-3-O-[3-hydroxymyristoyl] glucosamine N-acyltransferase
MGGRLSQDNGLTFEQLKSFDSLLKWKRGNQNLILTGISPAGDPRPFTLCFAKDRKYLDRIKESGKDISNILVITQPKAEVHVSERINNLAIVEDCDKLMLATSEFFYKKLIALDNDLVDGRQMGTAVVHPDAHIAQNVFIGAHVVIEAGAILYPGCVIMSHSRIGKGSIIFPNVTVYSRVQIGEHCRIHAGCVIGADGFGYMFKNAQHQKIWHLGGVVIEDHVEIGACTTVDRGTFSDTIIGRGCKIDNLVQVAHNAHLGQSVILCGQVGLSGSVTIGDYVVLGGKAAVAPEANIGAQAQIAGMAGVTGDVAPGAQMAGHPARPLREWLKGVAHLRKVSLTLKE